MKVPGDGTGGTLSRAPHWYGTSECPHGHVPVQWPRWSSSLLLALEAELSCQPDCVGTSDHRADGQLRADAILKLQPPGGAAK